jgi:hypothetical protein
MTVWLIETEAPRCGTTQHYAAYANEDPIDWLYENWFNQECQNLWENYSFYMEDQYMDEWDSISDEDKDEFYENNIEVFKDIKYEEWCSDCSLVTKEVNEEELDDYVPGGEGHLEIIYDERNEE